MLSNKMPYFFATNVNESNARYDVNSNIYIISYYIFRINYINFIYSHVLVLIFSLFLLLETYWENEGEEENK